MRHVEKGRRRTVLLTAEQDDLISFGPKIDAL